TQKGFDWLQQTSVWCAGVWGLWWSCMLWWGAGWAGTSQGGDSLAVGDGRAGRGGAGVAMLCWGLLGFAGPHFGWWQPWELPGEASHLWMTLEPLCVLATQLGQVWFLAMQWAPGKDWGCVTGSSVLAGGRPSQMSFPRTSACCQWVCLSFSPLGLW
ncbi:unnamed protein product, partial [Bubo scandiacus]